MVRIPGFHPGDPGSIPERENILYDTGARASIFSIHSHSEQLFYTVHTAMTHARTQAELYTGSASVAQSAGQSLSEREVTGSIPGSSIFFII